MLFEKKRLKLRLEIVTSNLMATIYVFRRDSTVPVLSILAVGLIKYDVLIYHIFNYISATVVNAICFTGN